MFLLLGFVGVFFSLLAQALARPQASSQYCIVSLIAQNVFVSYVGMFVGGDYVYDPYNFLGLNVR
jgi:hypothetical protein